MFIPKEVEVSVDSSHVTAPPHWRAISHLALSFVSIRPHSRLLFWKPQGPAAWRVNRSCNDCQDQAISLTRTGSLLAKSMLSERSVARS